MILDSIPEPVVPNVFGGLPVPIPEGLAREERWGRALPDRLPEECKIVTLADKEVTTLMIAPGRVPYGQVVDKASGSLKICRNIGLSANADLGGVFLDHPGHVMNAEKMITWYGIALFVFKRITVVTRE